MKKCPYICIHFAQCEAEKTIVHTDNDNIMEPVIAPISRELLKSELTAERLLRHTNRGGNELYIIDAHNAPNVMQEIGRLRMLHPEASLEELGQMLEKPVGKSGVNHRLRKLMEIHVLQLLKIPKFIIRI